MKIAGGIKSENISDKCFTLSCLWAELTLRYAATKLEREYSDA
jgi:hypothetical protein